LVATRSQTALARKQLSAISCQPSAPIADS
jgi:hypothetical protein